MQKKLSRKQKLDIEKYRARAAQQQWACFSKKKEVFIKTANGNLYLQGIQYSTDKLANTAAWEIHFDENYKMGTKWMLINP
jgi:hypothetical protein